jgi:hypothetical protein
VSTVVRRRNVKYEIVPLGETTSGKLPTSHFENEAQVCPKKTHTMARRRKMVNEKKVLLERESREN